MLLYFTSKVKQSSGATPLLYFTFASSVTYLFASPVNDYAYDDSNRFLSIFLVHDFSTVYLKGNNMHMIKWKNEISTKFLQKNFTGFCEKFKVLG